MRNTELPYIKGGQMLNSILALVLLICVIAVALFSGAFITAHAGHAHNCDGPHGNCTVCVRIQSTDNLLRQLDAAPPLIFTGILAAAAVPRVAARRGELKTLITLKARMNN